MNSGIASLCSFRRLAVLIGALPLVIATPAAASTGLDGQSLSLVWAIPFAGMLASIALGPRFAAQFWDPHYGKAAVFWAALALVPLAIVFGPRAAGEALFNVLALDYLPFILMLFALYTACGGLHIGGRLQGTPAVNTAFLAAGALAANLIGSIGAAMVLIRPLLRANAGRRSCAHVMVFFIFIVGNIGGALSPLGNPPLFLGFLHGIDFFWFAQHLWQELCCRSPFFSVSSISSMPICSAAKKERPNPLRPVGSCASPAASIYCSSAWQSPPSS